MGLPLAASTFWDQDSRNRQRVKSRYPANEMTQLTGPKDRIRIRVTNLTASLRSVAPTPPLRRRRHVGSAFRTERAYVAFSHLPKLG